MSNQTINFDYFPDDCLNEILDRLPPEELFKIERVNKRMRDLVAIKLRLNIKKIDVTCDTDYRCIDIGTCQAHLNNVARKQQIVFSHEEEDPNGVDCRDNPKIDTNLSSLLAKCSGVKSIDFGDHRINNNHLLMLAQRCPELECIKFSRSKAGLADWNLFFDQIGSKIVHLGIKYEGILIAGLRMSHFHPFKQLELFLETVAAKCTNIKQVDLSVEKSSGFIEAIKMLPKNCRVNLIFKEFDDSIFVPSGEIIENIDGLFVIGNQEQLSWSGFSNRVERLSSLKFDQLSDRSNDGPNRVFFAGLKKLEFRFGRRELGEEDRSGWLIECLSVSRFPQLESLKFHTCNGLDEDVYIEMLGQMKSIKKLIINSEVKDDCDDDDEEDDEEFKVKSVLPGPAIRCLTNLETFELNFKFWAAKLSAQPLQRVLKPLDSYENWVESLKKIIVRAEFCREDYRQNSHDFRHLMQQLKMEQNRVEVFYAAGIDRQLEMN